MVGRRHLGESAGIPAPPAFGGEEAVDGEGWSGGGRVGHDAIIGTSPAGILQPRSDQ